MEKSALAQSRAYSLFSQLFQVGLDAKTFAIIKEIPDLWEAIPGDFLTENGEFLEDAAAAAHFSLFGFNVFPFESVFLASHNILEGRVTQSVRIFYNQAGIELGSSSESPDHIAQELGFLSMLCGAEADYLKKDQRTEVYRVRDLQRIFLENHVLMWLPVFAIAIRQHEQLFYTELAELTVDLTISHLERLVSDAQINPPQVSLTSLPPLLRDKETGIKDIAEYLLTPAFSGFYLSRSGITKLAKQNNLMHGFGSRGQMFTNLLRSASEYEVFPSLMEDIEEIIGNWQSEYQRMAAHEALIENYVEPWLGRLERTKSILAFIEKAALEIV